MIDSVFVSKGCQVKITPQELIDESVLSRHLNQVEPLLSKAPNRREHAYEGVCDSGIFLGPELREKVSEANRCTGSPNACTAVHDGFFRRLRI